jgi:glucose-1-phosphate adenylyltransferase
MSSRVLTLILGGGRGTRLNPLTLHRAKPAVPLGGKYRLIDIPISNSINSGYRRIYVLTQFNSASLNQHVARTYQFDPFSDGFVQILAAEQTEQSGEWFQGTADAIRKQLRHFDELQPDLVLILAGDHLYRMDYRELVARHLEARADVTVSTIAIAREGCEGLGMVGVDEEGLIRRFREKPGPDEDLTDVRLPPGLAERWSAADRPYLASMGVYVFSTKALLEGLALPDAIDFGRDVLPALVKTHRVAAHRFAGYWEDIGTIEAFYRSNLGFCEPDPVFRFYHPEARIFTRPRFLPGSRFGDTRLTRTVVSEGCLIDASELDYCVIGLRSRIKKGARLQGVVMMGADYFEEDAVRASNAARGLPDIGIGEDCFLERAIVDKNARIGPRCVLRGAPGRADDEGPGWALRDGIVIIEKNAVLAAGTVV